MARGAALRAALLGAIASALCGATALQPRPLLREELGALAARGFCVVPAWIPKADIERVRRDVLAARAHGLLRTARVGSGETARADDSIRRTQMCSLLPGPPARVGSLDTRLELCAAVDRLRAELARAPELDQLGELTPFDTELAYLHYPEEGYYARHVDVPAAGAGWRRMGRARADGTALERWERRRTVSLLLYLNSGWDATSCGGQLRVFADGDAAARRGGGAGGAPEAAAGSPEGLPGADSGGAGAERYVDVVPEGGTLVLMRSERVEHEVLVTRRERQCVVGWLRTVRRADGPSDEGSEHSVGSRVL